MHRDIARQRFIAALQCRHAADSGAVDIGAQGSRGGDAHEAPHCHVLADLGDQRAAPLIQRRALVRQLEQVLQRSRARACKAAAATVRGESLKFVAARDEVGFAIHFDERGVVAGSLDRNRAFRGNTRGFLVRLGEPALAHELGRGVQITLGFDERLFALHHSGAGALAKLFDCICRNVHRILQPPAAAIPH